MPASQTILENASVRVALLTFVPGGATGRHQSIESEIGIVIEGELTVESPTGRQKLGPGGVYWMPGLTPHDVRNEGGAPGQDVGHLPEALRLRGQTLLSRHFTPRDAGRPAAR